MKRTEIIGYFFSLIALGVFVISLVAGKDDPLRGQAIYWFTIAVVSSLLPNLKRLKFKDLEIELRENIKRVEKKVDELTDTFFNSLGKVWREESEMPTFLKEKRNEHWDKFQSYVDSLDGKEKLETQISNTFHYLKDYGISVSQLKDKLKALGFYDGEVDNELSKNVINAIIEFQRANNLRHVDGVFGPLTYQRMSELLSRKDKNEKNASQCSGR